MIIFFASFPSAYALQCCITSADIFSFSHPPEKIHPRRDRRRYNQQELFIITSVVHLPKIFFTICYSLQVGMKMLLHAACNARRSMPTYRSDSCRMPHRSQRSQSNSPTHPPINQSITNNFFRLRFPFIYLCTFFLLQHFNKIVCSTQGKTKECTDSGRLVDGRVMFAR